MRPLLIPLALTATVFLGGCSISQTVTPVALSADLAPEICLIPAKDIRTGFTDAYAAALKAKGFQTRLLSYDASPAACPLVSNFTATWNWNMAIYLMYADIHVYQRGEEVGRAEYDARYGGLGFDKYINAEKKINEMTNQLFPVGASALNGKVAAAQ